MSVKLVAADKVIDNAEDAAPQPQVGGMRLNLGCNQRPRKGYVNVDIVNYPGVDVVADLEKRWPWEDGSVDEVTCADLPEHIRQWWDEYDVEGATTLEHIKQALLHPKRTYGIIHFMNEAWRVLRVGGLLDCSIPSTDYAGRGAWQDPTHVSYWNEATLRYFCITPGNYRGIYPNDIKAKFQPRSIKTWMPNVDGVTYLNFVIEKVE